MSALRALRDRQGPIEAALGLLLAGALAVLACIASGGRLAESPDISGVERGEALRHGVAVGNVSYHMPLSNLAAGWTSHHAGPAARGLAASASAALPLILTCGLAALLGSFPGAALAAAACLWPPLASYDGDPRDHLYAIVVLVAAVCTAWRAQKPSPTRSLAVGLAVGAGLLYRSPLAFFPAVLLVADVLRRRPATRRDALALLAPPALFLIPWLRMNYLVHREIVPFERGGATANIVAGAMGLVPAAHFDVDAVFKALVPGIRPERTDHVLRWAAREVSAHPFRYASSCVKRLARAVSWHPLLFLLAAASALSLRRIPEVQDAALLTSYLVAIHCAMAIRPGYFACVVPLLAALAAATSRRIWPEPALTGRRAQGALLAAAAICLASLVGFALWAGAVVERYASRLTLDGGRLERALREDPRDSWLLGKSGAAKLHRGDWRGAESDLRAALSLAGDKTAALWAWTDYAWVQTLLGRPSLLARHARDRDGAAEHDVDPGVFVLKAAALRRLGLEEQARSELRFAVAHTRHQVDGGELAGTAEGRRALALLAALKPESLAPAHLEQLPRAERAALLRELTSP